MELFMQGAESRAYISSYNGQKCLIKERFSKKYRHPELDIKLRRQRTNAEVRLLQKCAKNNIPAPQFFAVDKKAWSITMEFIEGRTLKSVLDECDLSTEDGTVRATAVLQKLADLVHSLHEKDIIHGDLTSSNVLVRDSDNSLVVIDFGLGFFSKSVEDKAVDLYVLERAFLSTHAASEGIFEKFLNMYHGGRGTCNAIMTRLLAVRARGRKKSMAG